MAGEGADMGRHRELGTAGEVIRQVVERDLSDWLSFLPQVFSLVLRYLLKGLFLKSKQNHITLSVIIKSWVDGPLQLLVLLHRILIQSLKANFVVKY